MRSREDSAWKRFCADRKLLAAHGVTDAELEFLEKVELFGSIKSVDDILLILRNIRRTGGSSLA
jgi:hypothetical protein